MSKTVRALLVGAFLTMLAPTAVLAAPVTWTIPNTPLSGGGAVSGSFVYDSALPEPLVSLNVVETGPTPGSYTFVGGTQGTIRFGQSTAVQVGANRVFYINLAGIPATPGPYTTTLVGTGPCFNATLGLCDAVVPGNSAPNVALSTGPLPVPTLNEWAMILLGLALAGGATVMIQRRRLTT